ncbi:hypothetical protein SDC9_204831 [bioreactor metagenome]|uniref:Uncharacterized protein n=1 Tax=bioreactor metagenome TaxID=1076179 RepID=A0A645J157_9ZZZZ
MGYGIHPLPGDDAAVGKGEEPLPWAGGTDGADPEPDLCEQAVRTGDGACEENGVPQSGVQQQPAAAGLG